MKLVPITEPASVLNSNQRTGAAGRDIDRLEKVFYFYFPSTLSPLIQLIIFIFIGDPLFLLKLVKKYESKKIPHVPWLDKKTFEEFEKIKSVCLFFLPPSPFSALAHFLIYSV